MIQETGDQSLSAYNTRMLDTVRCVFAITTVCYADIEDNQMTDKVIHKYIQSVDSYLLYLVV